MANQKNVLDEGVYAAVLTPMHADYSCHHKKLAAHCFEMIKKGCKGITLFGTTGEGPSFSLEERKDALQNLVSEGFNPKKIILSNGCCCITETIKLGEESLKHGCGALLVAPPSFYKNITDEGILSFYREIIHKVASANLRLILYHIPQLSGVPISLKVIKILIKEFPEVVIGIKESEGNLDFTKKILAMFPGFKVYVGNEKHIIEAVYLGAAGTICGIANLYPELICSLYKQGKEPVANPESIENIFEAMKGVQFISVAKALLEKREGICWQKLRPPLMPLDPKERMRIFSALEKYELEKKEG